MKILFFTPSFYPNTGGLENVARSIAKSLVFHQFSIQLITLTPLQEAPEVEDGYEIIRCPNRMTFFKAYLHCDIFFHHNVSLKGIWPLLLFPKKWVILHHLTYYNFFGRLSLLERLKRGLSYFGKNVSVSTYVNQTLPKSGSVIYNPYDDEIFYPKPEVKKDKKILFVGRLVSDKGCMLLLEAIYLLKKKGIEVYLDIVGDGPEQKKLAYYCKEQNISNLVQFLGLKNGNALADEYRKHQTLIIPSIWKEPFGLVALEGIACGCNVIASDGDGLTEACLGIGYFFKKGDVISLCEAILEHHIDIPLNKINKLPIQLKAHHEDEIAKAWVNYLEAIYEN